MDVFISKQGCDVFHRGRLRHMTGWPERVESPLRVFGNPEAAAFLLHHRGVKLSVASPRFIYRQDQADGEWLVRAAEVANLFPPSIGGWHEWTANDTAHYSLAAAPHFGFQDHVATHPLSRYFRFLGRVGPTNPQAFGYVAASIIDPRWFIDHERPDRRSALFAYLGLRPRNERHPFCPQVRGRRMAVEQMAADGPAWGFIQRRYREAADERAKLRVLQSAVRLMVSFWLAELSGVKEMHAPEHLLHGFEERDDLLRAWNAGAAA